MTTRSLRAERERAGTLGTAIGDQCRLGRRGMLGAALAAPFVVAAQGHAETWPTKPIRVIVPGPAGGLLDVACRAVGEGMQRELGQPWLVDSRPGANTIVGAQAFLAAPADGYTLYQGVTSHVVLPFLTKVPFDVIADFNPIAMVGNSTSLVCVPPASPADSIAGFVAHARANPGRLNYLNSAHRLCRHVAA